MSDEIEYAKCGHFSSTKVGDLCDYCRRTKLPGTDYVDTYVPSPGSKAVAPSGVVEAIFVHGKWRCPKTVGEAQGDCGREPRHAGVCVIASWCVLVVNLTDEER